MKTVIHYDLMETGRRCDCDYLTPEQAHQMKGPLAKRWKASKRWKKQKVQFSETISMSKNES